MSTERDLNTSMEWMNLVWSKEIERGYKKIPVFKTDVMPTSATVQPNQSDTVALAALRSKLEWEKNLNSRSCSHRVKQFCYNNREMLAHFRFEIEKAERKLPSWIIFEPNVNRTFQNLPH